MGSSDFDAAAAVRVPESIELSGADDAIFEAPAVLRIIWADPQHMAEHLAVWSLAQFGRRADVVVEKLFELAAVSGRDPTDRLRAAELLVLLGAYDSTAEAGAALAALPPHPKARSGRRLPAGTRWQMIKRMAYLLEVFGPADETRGRVRATLGWVGIGVLFLVGMVLPLVWVPYMAYSSRRITLRVGNRARRYYDAAEQGGAGVSVRRREQIQVGGTVALLRMTLLVVFPIIVALVGLLTGFSFVGGRWLTAGLLLLAVSALATLAWLGYRWWRHRHRVAP